MHIIREAIYRNFGGLTTQQLDNQQILDNTFSENSLASKSDEKLDSENGLHWIEENSEESRALRILHAKARKDDLPRHMELT